MLTERPWSELAMLRFFMALLITLAAAKLLIPLLLLHGAPAKPRLPTFGETIFGSLAFHGTILAAVFLFLLRQRIPWSEAFGLRRSRTVRTVWLVVGVSLLAMVVAMGLHFLASFLLSLLQVDQEKQMVVKIIQQARPVGEQVVLAVMTIGLAPLAEEVFFRGILYASIKQWGFPQVALWGSAVLFAAIHANVAAFLPLLFLSVVWAWLYEKTDNLLAPICAHSLFNGLNYLLMNQPRLQQLLEDWLGRHN